MMNADAIREKYLEFFRSKKHKVASSDSLVPKDDPTVLFTPAGMNQFKKQFLGMITDFTRATSSQRCLRTDDLDKVGKTDCHHTFFEMLGNFSFGDYFKEEAIAWGWEFLTKEMGIAPDRLWVSVYKDDDEAYTIWRDKIKFPVDKIVRLGDKDNFWPSEAKEKGPNGPCGPCSEIFVDLGKDVGCKKADCSPACSCGRFIEIWNLVFTQFNRKDGGVLEPLPQKNIDTGMGLERITAVMQGVTNNFQTDLFQPIIKEIAKAAVKRSPGDDKELYAITDHVRAVVFSIFDGILPSNEGRGYVVRKLIRKSILHMRGLGIHEPFLYKLVAIVCQVMHKPYPELTGRRENIAEIILAEEKNFISTLNSSDNLITETISPVLGNNRASDSETATNLAFKAVYLYDTHGIPAEITNSLINKLLPGFLERNMKVYLDSFEKKLGEQKERSKATSAMQGDVFSVKEAQLKGIAATKFVGYTSLDADAHVAAILTEDGLVDTLPEGRAAKVVLDTTSFYAESGGQAGDKGVIVAGDSVFDVADTQKFEKVFVHSGTMRKGTLGKSASVKAMVDAAGRMSIARNHTATHLLQAALRTVLGTHVQQQGSQVSAEGLRFDFTHFRDVKKDELDRIEQLVNGYVCDNIAVVKKEMDLEEAKKEGALAFFAEKYEEKVRVVSVPGISKEFCGGTHLDATGSIGFFKILNESSIASGVRRIEAVTGTGAFQAVKEAEQVIDTVAEMLKTPVAQIEKELEKRLKAIKDLEKQLAAQKMAGIASSLDDLIKKVQVVNGVRILAERVAEADMDILRKTVDMIKQKEPSIAVSLGSVANGKVCLVVGSNVPTVDSGSIVKQIASEIGGSGGGRKDFAQAGGTNPAGLDKAFARFKELVK